MTSRFLIGFAALTIFSRAVVTSSGPTRASPAISTTATTKKRGEVLAVRPDDEDCIETMEIKVCNADGECSSGGEPTTHDHHAH
jgi:hypothetical protein